MEWTTKLRKSGDGVGQYSVPTLAIQWFVYLYLTDYETIMLQWVGELSCIKREVLPPCRRFSSRRTDNILPLGNELKNCMFVVMGGNMNRLIDHQVPQDIHLMITFIENEYQRFYVNFLQPRSDCYGNFV